MKWLRDQIKNMKNMEDETTNGHICVACRRVFYPSEGIKDKDEGKFRCFPCHNRFRLKDNPSKFLTVERETKMPLTLPEKIPVDDLELIEYEHLNAKDMLIIEGFLSLWQKDDVIYISPTFSTMNKQLVTDIEFFNTRKRLKDLCFRIRAMIAKGLYSGQQEQTPQTTPTTSFD